MGEHGGADVAAVHHYALFESEGLLLGYQSMAHGRDGGDGRHVLAHGHGSDFALYVYAVKQSVL